MVDNLNIKITDRDAVLLQEAYEDYKSGLFDEAGKKFNRLLSKYPHNFVILNDYGVCLWQQGKLKDAFQKFVDALRLKPDYEEAKLNLSNVYEAIGYCTGKNENDVFGYLNTPDVSGRCTIKGVQRIEGWALSKSNNIDIEICLNDERMGYAEYGMPRFDVLIHYPHVKDSDKSGFKFDLNTIDLPDGNHKITIVAHAKGNKSVIKEGFLEINNRDLPPFEENIAKCHKSFNERKTVLDNYPLSLYLEPTRSCNLRCIMCRPEPVRSPDLSLETFNKLIPYLPYCKVFTLNGAGESLINPDFLKILKSVKDYSNTTSVIGFNTNAILLDEKKIEFIVSIGINHISISIDSPNKDTYEKIRRGASFDRLVRNLDQILRIKKLYDTEKPYLVFHMVVMECNAHEISEYINFANEYNVKDVMLSNVEAFSRQGVVVDIEPLCKHGQYLSYYLQAKQLACEHGIKLHGTATESFESLLCSNNSSRKDIKRKEGFGILCPEPFQAVYVSAEGNISPCNLLADAGVVMGNINEQSLKNIWNNSMYINLRESLLEGRLHPMCEYCIQRGLMCQKLF